MSSGSALLQPVQALLPTVSVIVPVYNGEIDLPDLLDCLLAQTYPLNLVEYLLVDNGSVDRTRQILQSFAAVTALTVQMLSQAQIQSSYAARNTGIEAAMGEILVFTDADCRPQPDWLYQMVQPFVDQAIGLVAGEIVALPGNSWLERYADRHATLSQKHTLSHAFCAYGQTANLAVRRTTLKQVGLFRPHLTTGGDADLCWRILQSGHWRIEWAEQAVVRHRHRSTLAELWSQWQRYGRSNRYLHDLYGIELTREMTPRDYLHRCARWLLKEVPTAISSSPQGLTVAIDRLIDTPLDLFCRRARVQGQRQAKLPDAARSIAPSLPRSPQVSTSSLNL